MEQKGLRYSDEELEEFRLLIEEKLAKAQQEYDDLVGSYDDTAGDENRGMNSSESMEESTIAAQKAEVKHLADRQLQFISKLKAALVRIDNKTYGICRETGTLIPKARLRAVPHATLSIEAKNK